MTLTLNKERRFVLNHMVTYYVYTNRMNKQYKIQSFIYESETGSTCIIA